MTTGLPRLMRSGARRAVAGLLSPLGSVVGVRTPQSLLALTFDDGPDPEVTPRVLDVLAAHEDTATFFVLLTRVRKNRELLDRILAAGHEVGLHGPDHRRLTGFSPAEVAARLSIARSELEQASGRRITWFRPPYGAQLPVTALAIRRAGLTPVLWGPSLWDWKDAGITERRAQAMKGLRAGAIVLAHDGIAGPRDGDPTGRPPELDRAAWLNTMLTDYRGLGFRGRSLGEVVATGHAVRRARFIR